MGIYLNPGFLNYQEAKKNKFFVDKSMLISALNEAVSSDSKLFCITRPRRFVKSMAANMIAAYYSKDCDSHKIFSYLKISADPSLKNISINLM